MAAVVRSASACVGLIASSSRVRVLAGGEQLGSPGRVDLGRPAVERPLPVLLHPAQRIEPFQATGGVPVLEPLDRLAVVALLPPYLREPRHRQFGLVRQQTQRVAPFDGVVLAPVPGHDDPRVQLPAEVGEPQHGRHTDEPRLVQENDAAAGAILHPPVGQQHGERVGPLEALAAQHAPARLRRRRHGDEGLAGFLDGRPQGGRRPRLARAGRRLEQGDEAGRSEQGVQRLALVGA